MAQRKPFSFKSLPPLHTFRRETFYIPEEVLQELYDLASNLKDHHPLARALFDTPPVGRVTWDEVRPWLESPGQEIHRKRHTFLTLSQGLEAAFKASREAYLAANPHRTRKPGRPFLAGDSTRTRALVGVVLGILLDECAGKLRATYDNDNSQAA